MVNHEVPDFCFDTVSVDYRFQTDLGSAARTNVTVFSFACEGRGADGSPLGVEFLFGAMKDAVEKDSLSGRDYRIYALDTQQQINSYGRVDTAYLAEVYMANPTGRLWLSIPQGAWMWAQWFLINLSIRYQGRYEQHPDIILGNWAPTLSYQEIFDQFPELAHKMTIVRGEGVGVIADISRSLDRGERPVGKHNTVMLTDVNDNTHLAVAPYRPPTEYPEPDRIFLGRVIDDGGVIRVLTKSGCESSCLDGPCTYCIQLGQMLDLDLGTIRRDLIYIRDHGLSGRQGEAVFVEIADEEFLGTTDEGSQDNRRAAIARQNQTQLENIANIFNEVFGRHDGDESGHSFSFGISTRTDTFLEAHKMGLVAKLKQAGLQRVYFGVENGSKKVLHRMHKGTTPEINEEAIQLALKEGLEVELGYITTARWMDREMLNDSIDYLGKPIDGRIMNSMVSSVMNQLEVRKNTSEWNRLMSKLTALAREKNITEQEEIKAFMEKYIHDNYEIDTGRVRLTREVYECDEAYELDKIIEQWKEEQRRLYFALKHTVRADPDPERHQTALGLLEKFRALDYDMVSAMKTLLFKADRLPDDISMALTGFRKARDRNVRQIRRDLASGKIKDQKRSIALALERYDEQHESRQIRTPVLKGMVAVFTTTDENNQRHVLITREMNREDVELPAEKIPPCEGRRALKRAMKRLLREEFGVSRQEIQNALQNGSQDKHGQGSGNSLKKLIRQCLPPHRPLTAFYTYTDEKPYQDMAVGSYPKGLELYHVHVEVPYKAAYRFKARFCGPEIADTMWISLPDLKREIGLGRLKLKPNVALAINALDQVR